MLALLPVLMEGGGSAVFVAGAVLGAYVTVYAYRFLRRGLS